MHARAEIGIRKGLDGASQVAEGDAPVDDESFNLVKNRQVAGIGGIPPVAPPGHHRVNRWRLGLHQPDLDGRGVGSQQHRFWRTQPQVEGVPHSPGRVGGRHVEGFEVVPVRLRLRAFRHRKAHGDEGVLQLGAGLGDEVEVAPPSGQGRERERGRPDGELGEVKSFGIPTELAVAAGEGGGEGVAALLQPGAGRVDPGAHLLAPLGRHVSEQRVETGELRTFAQDQAGGVTQAGSITGRLEPGHRVSLDGFQGGAQRFDVRGRQGEDWRSRFGLSVQSTGG